MLELHDINEFWRLAQPMLEADPANNTVNLSVCRRFLEAKASGGEPEKMIPRFFIADEHAVPLRAIAIATIQNCLVLSAKDVIDLKPFIALFQNKPPVTKDIVGRAK